MKVTFNNELKSKTVAQNCHKLFLRHQTSYFQQFHASAFFFMYFLYSLNTSFTTVNNSDVLSSSSIDKTFPFKVKSMISFFLVKPSLVKASCASGHSHD